MLSDSGRPARSRSREYVRLKFSTRQPRPDGHKNRAFRVRSLRHESRSYTFCGVYPLIGGR